MKNAIAFVDRHASDEDFDLKVFDHPKGFQVVYAVQNDSIFDYQVAETMNGKYTSWVLQCCIPHFLITDDSCSLSMKRLLTIHLSI